MSVLLEALKKAADNKKQSEDGPDRDLIQSDLNKKQTVDDDELQEIGVEETPDVAEKEGFSLSLKPEVTSTDTDETKESDKQPTIKETESAGSEVAAEKTQPVVDSGIKIKDESKSLETINPLDDSELIVDDNKFDSSKEPDDSYDWSMNNLPGYELDDASDSKVASQENTSKAISENNQILTTNKRFEAAPAAYSMRQFIFGASSNVALYLLFAFFTLSTIAFFSVYYFQQQSEVLDRDMLKYDFVRTELPSLPATQKVDESVELSKVEQGVVTDTTTDAGSIDSSIDSTSVDNATVETDSGVKHDIDAQKLNVDTAKAVKPKVPASKSTVVKSTSDQSPSLAIETVSQKSNLMNAYTALYANESDKAKAGFLQILEVEPHNIEALNGLGSVYAQTGQTTEAIQTYQKVLSETPTNQHAIEAMVSLINGSTAGPEWKNEIKTALEDNPGSAILNASLGNLYALDSDWKLAQAYYFKAHALDENNPDYLMNLAISLDHLGQYKLAEQYYTSALVNARSGNATFDEVSVKKRLVVIRQFIGQTD